MNAAKTSAERVHEVRQRRRALGLVRLELWAHPADHESIKDHAGKLQRRRQRATKASASEKPTE